MLAEHSIFKGKLVGAHKEPTRRRIVDAYGHYHTDPEKYDFTVDNSTNEVLGVVSDRYTLVQNADIVNALDLALTAQGIEVVPVRAQYHNGRAYYRFQVPSVRMKVGTDPSETTATIDLRNDYKGNGGLSVLSGWFRLVCTNGLMVGTVASQASKRHVGDINVFEFINDAVQQMVARFEVDRLLADTLGDTHYDHSDIYPHNRKSANTAIRHDVDSGNVPDLIDSLLADTADRYHRDMRIALRTNVRDIGANLWAVAQAVSEVATHRMQARSDGRARNSFNAGADEWASRQLRTIVEYAGVK